MAEIQLMFLLDDRISFSQIHKEEMKTAYLLSDAQLLTKAQWIKIININNK